MENAGVGESFGLKNVGKSSLLRKAIGAFPKWLCVCGACGIRAEIQLHTVGWLSASFGEHSACLCVCACCTLFVAQEPGSDEDGKTLQIRKIGTIQQHERTCC